MIDLSDLLGRYQGKKFVFVSGNFNIIHPGHVRMLRFAKSVGEVLVVGLFKDEARGALVSFEFRREGLLALKMVDYVIPLDRDELLSCLELLRPQIVVKGKEHEEISNIEQPVVSAYGGHLLFSSGEHIFSSSEFIRSELLKNIKYARTPGILPLDFAPGQGLSKEGVIKRLDSFKGLRVLVIGDLVVDEYIQCDAIGMSQEDPTIVVSPVEVKSFVGAAGFVAKSFSNLGALVNFVSIVGRDIKAEESARDLKEYKVETHFVLDDSRPTTVKQRFRAQGKTLLRVSHLRTHDAADDYCEEVLGVISDLMSSTDLVVFSDFNYGCLPQGMVNKVIASCLKHQIAYVADSQASSQISDVSRFRGASFMAATEREARLAVNDFKSGIQNVANKLIRKAAAEHLFIKLGPEGLIALKAKGSELVTYSLPALNSNPVDVVGAGDSLLAASSLALRSGASVYEAAYIGSIAAALQISRVGNCPITVRALRNLIMEH